MAQHASPVDRCRLPFHHKNFLRASPFSQSQNLKITHAISEVLRDKRSRIEHSSMILPDSICILAFLSLCFTAFNEFIVCCNVFSSVASLPVNRQS